MLLDPRPGRADHHLFPIFAERPESCIDIRPGEVIVLLLRPGIQHIEELIGIRPDLLPRDPALDPIGTQSHDGEVPPALLDIVHDPPLPPLVEIPLAHPPVAELRLLLHDPLLVPLRIELLRLRQRDHSLRADIRPVERHIHLAGRDRRLDVFQRVPPITEPISPHRVPLAELAQGSHAPEALIDPGQIRLVRGQRAGVIPQPPDERLFQIPQHGLQIPIERDRLRQQIVQVQPLARADKVGRAELHTVPELLQQVLQLVDPDIVDVDCHGEELMGIPLRVRPAVEADRRDQPEGIPDRFFQTVQLVRDHILPVTAARPPDLGEDDVPLRILLVALPLQGSRREHIPVELLRRDLREPPFLHHLPLLPVDPLPRFRRLLDLLRHQNHLPRTP